MKNIKAILIPVVMLLVTAAHAEKKEYTAGFMRVPPKIDGDIINDSAWHQLTWENDFRKFRQCTPASRKTRFKIGYAYGGLYIAIECAEPEMNKISMKRKNMQELWHDDNVEVFIASDKLKYRHFVVNAAGARANARCNKSKSYEHSFIWKWQAKIKRNSKSWTAEIMIPYHLLEFFPSPEIKVGLNICRTATPVNEISSWAPQRISFHDIQYFGTLRFNDKLSEQELDKLIQNRKSQKITADTVILKKKWNKFRQGLHGSDDLYKSFTAEHKSRIVKLDKMIKDLNSPAEGKYNTAIKAFKKLKEELVMFDWNLGEQIIKNLTNQ